MMNVRLQLGFLTAGLLLLVAVACDNGDSAPVAVPTTSTVEASAASEDSSGGSATAARSSGIRKFTPQSSSSTLNLS